MQQSYPDKTEKGPEFILREEHHRLRDCSWIPLSICMDAEPSALVNDWDKVCTVPNTLDVGSREYLRFKNHRCPPGPDHTTSPWP